MKRLSDIFKSISNLFAKPFADFKYRNITEESVRAQLDDIRLGLQITDDAYQALGEKQLNQLYELVRQRLKFEPTIVKSTFTFNVFLTAAEQSLKGRSRSLGLIKSINQTTKQIFKLLDHMEHGIGTLITNKDGVIINDMQVSHAAFFGMLESIRIFYMINSYLLVIFSHVVVMPKSGNDKIAKYIVEYMTRYQETYHDVIDQMLNNQGDMLMTKIAQLKQQGKDFRINSSSGLTSRLEPVTIIAFSLTALVVSYFAIPFVGEKYIEIRHHFYEELKEHKKWLEHHVASMKLALDDVDPNDPEYAKLQKIITYYDDKIASMEKTIQKYFEE